MSNKKQSQNHKVKNKKIDSKNQEIEYLIDKFLESSTIEVCKSDPSLRSGLNGLRQVMSRVGKNIRNESRKFG